MCGGQNKCKPETSKGFGPSMSRGSDCKLERLEEAFIYQRSIDSTTYEQQRDRMREKLALAELELHEARIENVDIEGVLGFAEHLLENAAQMWVDAGLEQRRQLQTAIFPEGLPFSGQGFGTAPTCLAFMQLEKSGASENGMASSPPGFEPGFQP